MKLLSRVILLVNGAIDAMYNDTMKNNEGAGVHIALVEKVTPAPGLVLVWGEK